MTSHQSGTLVRLVAFVVLGALIGSVAHWHERTQQPPTHTSSDAPYRIEAMGDGAFSSTTLPLGLKAFYTADAMVLEPAIKNQHAAGWRVKVSHLCFSADGQALTYNAIEPELTSDVLRFNDQDATVEYRNGQEGVRQNFIVHHAPTATNELCVHAEVKGALLHKSHDKEVHFYRNCGTGSERLISYNGLLAYDAKGRELPAHFDVDKDELSIRVDARDAVYPVTIDPLSTTASWSVEGNEIGARMGRGARTAGDVNGDGYSDVVVSAPLLNAGSSDAGKVFVYHGGPAGLSVTPAWTRSGTATSQEYGAQVCTACDVNGDGFSDLMIGTPKFSLTSNSQEGRVEIFHGSATGLANTPAFVRTGTTGSRLGSEIAGLGDVNSDGFSDVAMSTGGTISTATVHLGSSAGTSSVVTLSVSGPSNGQYPVQIAGAGDVNVDGFGDVVFGIPGAMPNETNPHVKLHTGNASGLASTAQVTITGSNGSRFGQALSTAGDQDGDGDADVYIGAPFQTVNANALAGQGLVYKGSSTSPLSASAVVVTGASAGLIAARFMEPLGDVEDDGKMDGFFSTTVSVVWRAAAGDVNGDGYADILESDENFSGPETSEGRVRLFLGKPPEMPTSPQFLPTSNQAGERLGQRVAGVGDVNGDGFADMLVTAPFFDNGQMDEGRATVYYGSLSGFTFSTTPPFGNATTVEGNQANAHFGMSGGPAGDVNDDGYSDVIIGAPDFDNGQTDEGRAFLYLGGPSGLSTTPIWTGESDQANAHFGTEVCMIIGMQGANGGVAVGAPEYDDGQTDEGAVFVYNVSNLLTFPGVDELLEVNQANARFGTSVSTGGDINGDGFGDLLVGAPLYDNGTTDEGAAFSFLGSMTGLSTTGTLFKDANQSNGHAGTSICCLGDIDGDGFSDAAVGMPGISGGATNGGGFTVHKGQSIGLNPANANIVFGTQTGALFGSFLQSAGDVNNDGYSDLFVGQPLFDGVNGVDCGKAYIYTATPGATPVFSSDPSWAVEGASAGERLGTSGGYIGDSEGDGFTEIATGAPFFSPGGVVREYNSTFTLGVKRPCRLYCSDMISPLSDNGDGCLFFDPEMALGFKARSPLGRSKCRLLVERVDQGVGFAGFPAATTSTQFTIAQPNFTDIGASGTELKVKFGKGVTRSRTRARLRYHPSTALTGQLFGHWRYAGNILANNIGVWYEVDSFTNGGGEDGSGTVTSTSEADPLPDEHMIFPVPAHDVLNITNAGPRPTDYRVYNCTGSLIVEGSAGATSSLWTADWPSGTYIIIFNTKGSTSHRSFVVDH